MNRCASTFVLFAFCQITGMANARAQDQTVRIDPSHARRTTRLHMGDTLLVRLRTHAGTNYRWVVGQTHSHILAFKGSTAQEETPGRLGGPVLQQFQFLATHAGHTLLPFTLVQTWHYKVLGKRNQEVSFQVRVTSPSARDGRHPRGCREVSSWMS